MKTTYSTEGEYQLTKCVLRSGAIELDLTGMLVDIAIYENMFDQIISGDISVVDTHGIDDCLPLYGNEVVEIEFYTAGVVDNPINITGCVYKIDPAQQLSGSSSGYVIRFADEFLIRSSRTAYRYGHQTELSNMVTLVYDNTMKDSLTRKKSVDVVKTRGIDHYVGNKVSPLSIIQKLSERSVSVNSEYGYIFFQSNRGFNFKPLEYLYKQEPVTEFINRDAGVFNDVKQKTIERFNAIQSIEISDTNNVFSDRVAKGIHGSRWYSFDMITKSIHVYDYDKTSQFKPQNSLSVVPHMKNQIDPSYDGLHVMEVQANAPSGLTDKSLNVMQLENVFSFRAVITCNGDSTLAVGDVVLVNLPQWNMNRGELAKPKAGKFLITEIKHVLTKRTYIQSIVIQKDGFDAEIAQ